MDTTKINDYTIHEQIGKGTFGKIYRAQKGRSEVTDFFYIIDDVAGV